MARKIQILETLDAGADVLIVRGLVDGEKVEVRGWLSAMTNHYDADAYDAKGELKCDAKREKVLGSPRAMTPAERRAYCERLLELASPAAAMAPAPTKITLFPPDDAQ